MNRAKRWTAEEDKILVQLIEKNPHNLSKAFLIASSKLERTKGACQFRWYQHLGNSKNNSFDGIAFTVMSKKKNMKNRKNHIEGKSKTQVKKTKASIWNKILAFLGL